MVYDHDKTQSIKFRYPRVECPERFAAGGESKDEVEGLEVLSVNEGLEVLSVNEGLEVLSVNEGQFYFYILECSDNSLYCGSSNHLLQRLKTHNSGKAAKWTKIRRPVQLVYFETYNTLLAAMQRELQVKGWIRNKKEKLIKGEWAKQI